tara:strand:- start:4518 stop:4802 length:285 start_codon:yes stop_codon:yes gene_type:complete
MGVTICDTHPPYRAVFFFVFFIFTLMYFLWGRKLDDPKALWFDVPIGRSYSLQEAEQRMEVYAEMWGSLYELEVHQSGSYPKGIRQPCFIPGCF